MDKLGKYEILEEVGKGGFGIVYKGRDPFIRRLVAIKTCSSDSQEIRQRFFREAQIAGNLHHPNVVTIHDFGVEDETPFIVQEYLRGEDLDTKIKTRQPLTFEDKLHYLIGIAEGLAYAHSKGVIHRDIKPSNIRITQDGDVKVMDFGIAKLSHVKSHLTQTGTTLGTVTYLSPEQLKGGEVDHRCDIFSFGVLAYELFAYRRPFDGDSVSRVFYEILHGEPQPLSDYVPSCPARLGELVLRCLTKEPAERFSSFAQVIAELRKTLDELDQDTLQLTTTHELLTPPTQLIDTDSQKEAEKLAREGGLPGESPASGEVQKLQRLFQRARTAVEAGDLTDAEMSIDLARRDHSDTLVFHELFDPLLSRVEQLRRERQQAIELAEQRDALLEEAQLHRRADELTAALTALERCLEIVPDDREALELQRELSGELDRRRLEEERQRALQQAVTEIEGLIESADGKGARTALDRARSTFGDREPAFAALADRVEELQRRLEANELGRQARQALSDGEVDRARQLVDRALALRPKEGSLRKLSGEIAEALEARRREEERQAAIAEERRALDELLAAGELSAATARVAKALRTWGEDPLLTAAASGIDEARRDVQITELRTEAEDAIAAGDLEGAGIALEQARELGAPAERLRDLRERLARAAAERQRREELEHAREAAASEIREALDAGDLERAGETLEESRRRLGTFAELDALAQRLEQERREREQEEVRQARRRSESEIAAALEAGDLERAGALLADGRKRFGDSPELDALGERLEEARRAERLEAALTEVSSRLEAAELDAARTGLEQASELDADDPRIAELAGRIEHLEREQQAERLTGQAERALAEGDQERAIELLERAQGITGDPRRWQPLLARAREELEQRRREEERRRRQTETIAAIEAALDGGELERAAHLLAAAAKRFDDDSPLAPLTARLEDAHRQQRYRDAARAAASAAEAGDLEAAREAWAAAREHADDPTAVDRHLATVERAIAERRERERVEGLVAEAESRIEAALGSRDLAAAEQALAAAASEIGEEAPLRSLAERVETERRRREAAARTEAARRAVAGENWHEAVENAERARQLDPEAAEATELLHTARSALEAEERERQRREALDRAIVEAEALLGRGRLRGARQQLAKASELGDDRRLKRLAEKLERAEETARQKARARRPWIAGGVATAVLVVVAVLLVPRLLERSPAPVEEAEIAVAEQLGPGVESPPEASPSVGSDPLAESESDRRDATSDGGDDGSATESTPSTAGTESATGDRSPRAAASERTPDRSPSRGADEGQGRQATENESPTTPPSESSASVPTGAPSREPERARPRPSVSEPEEPTPAEAERPVETAPDRETATRETPRERSPEPTPPAPRQSSPERQPAERAEPAAPTPSPSPGLPEVDDRALIRALLGQWERAWESLDAEAVARLDPSQNAAAMRSAFRNFARQELEFDWDACQWEIRGDRATVRCPNRLVVEPRGGGRSNSVDRTTTFVLQKQGAAWRITESRNG